jgi:hypothetical protein
MLSFKKWLIIGSCAFMLGLAFAPALAQPVYAGASDPCDSADPNNPCNKFVTNYLNPFILLLSGLVGVAAVISIVVAGIQYSSSSDDPSAISKAKKRIFETVIGLLAYAFLLAFLNYIVPGGVI